MKIGIIVAMDKEFAQLATLLDHQEKEAHSQNEFILGSVEEKDIVLQKCGIGKVNSAIGTVEMIRNYHPDVIISSGCAGGADPQLNVGDVVVATQCVYHDAYCGDNVSFGQIMGMPERYDTSQELIDKALSMTCKETIRAGLTVSGDWFVDSREKMQDIIYHFPEAKAVDMESCSVAQTCYLYDTPFVSFRIISDVPLKDCKAAQYFDFWASMADGSFDVTRNFLKTL